jgi:hypothetical protein
METINLDFTFIKEQDMIRKDIREFAKNKIGPKVANIDEKGAIPNELIKSMADINILCMSVDKKYEGLNADPVTVGMAAIKKNADIAVGSIVGSNIFNVFFILGISAIIRPLPFDDRMNIDLIVVILASMLLFLTMFTGRKRNLLERWEGIIFIAFYVAFIIFSFMRG